MIARKSESNDGRRRAATTLSIAMEKSLSAYATAAAAAGVSLLALTPSAQAKIVYTPANINIPSNGVPVPLDLNNDGTADFSFVNTAWGGSEGEFRNLLSVFADNASNGIWGRGSFDVSFPRAGPAPMKAGGIEMFPSALRRGAKIGPNKSHFQGRSKGLMASSYGAWGLSRGLYFYGQWDGYTQHRYLGLKFVIGTDVHYGWARLNVTANLGIAATITGYAYETVPNKPIITGKTKGPDVVILEPASLGRLAQGASAIPAWRPKPAP